MALEARLSYIVKWSQDSTCDLSMCQIQPNQVKDLLCAVFAPPPSSGSGSDPNCLTGPRIPVQRLCLGGNKLTSASVAELAEFLRFSVVAKEKIEALDFAYDRFGNLFCAPQARNCIGDEGAAQIATVLAIAGNLRELSFAGNNIGPRGVTSLVNSFEKQRALGKRPIEILDLNMNNIGLEGAKTLAKALRAPECTLRTLKVSDNRIGLPGLLEIIRALKANTTMKQLDISWNMCKKEDYNVSAVPASEDGVQFAMEVADLLSQPTCALESITLDGNLLGNNGAMLVLKALQDNPTLPMKHFSVGGSFLDDSAATHFAGYVRENTVLRSLDLSRNLITNEGVATFKAALTNNTTLTALSFRDNHITDHETLEWMKSMMQKNSTAMKTNMTKARMARLMPTTSESHFFGQSPESKEASKRESTVSSSVSSKKNVRTRRLTASSQSMGLANQADAAGGDASAEGRSRARSSASNTSGSMKTSSPDLDTGSVKSIKSASGSGLKSPPLSSKRNHSHSPSPSPGPTKLAVVGRGDSERRARAQTETVTSISKPKKRSSESNLGKQGGKGLTVKSDADGIVEKEQKREKQREEYEKKKRRESMQRSREDVSTPKDDYSAKEVLAPVAVTPRQRHDSEKRKRTSMDKARSPRPKQEDSPRKKSEVTSVAAATAAPSDEQDEKKNKKDPVPESVPKDEPATKAEPAPSDDDASLKSKKKKKKKDGEEPKKREDLQLESTVVIHSNPVAESKESANSKAQDDASSTTKVSKHHHKHHHSKHKSSKSGSEAPAKPEESALKHPAEPAAKNDDPDLGSSVSNLSEYDNSTDDDE